MSPNEPDAISSAWRATAISDSSLRSARLAARYDSRCSAGDGLANPSAIWEATEIAVVMIASETTFVSRRIDGRTARTTSAASATASCQTLRSRRPEDMGKHFRPCLLYTSDAADERSSVD